ncbi:hypothetical protein ABB41_10835 [Lactococcus lactis]|jgi:hypothetical protein|nr:hypothetical protein ABB41_10835 [Lactococcus lactis]
MGEYILTEVERMKKKINAWEVEQQINYIDNFMAEIQSTTLKDALLEFVITFSVFENIFGTIKLSENPFEKLDNSFADTPYQFFRDRYINDGKLANNYKKTLWQIGFQEDGIAREITPLLKKQDASGAEKSKVVYHIGYRFRNNLFHGNKGKEPFRLAEYEECFVQITKFMKSLMKSLTEGLNES